DPDTRPSRPPGVRLSARTRARPYGAPGPLHCGRRGRAAGSLRQIPVHNRVGVPLRAALPCAGASLQRARTGHPGLRRPRDRDEPGRGFPDPPRRPGHRAAGTGELDGRNPRRLWSERLGGRADRPRQPRQCRRRLSQCGGVRGRRVGSRPKLLRSALPQGDPGLGGRELRRTLRSWRAGRRADVRTRLVRLRRLGAHAARRHFARASPAAGKNRAASRRGGVWPPAGHPGARARRSHPDGGGFRLAQRRYRERHRASSSRIPGGATPRL
ncbi:MAG: macromolecule metabolism; macromolecule synthesis, modification, partial [uncultured Microvirga sp.]